MSLCCSFDDDGLLLVDLRGVSKIDDSYVVEIVERKDFDLMLTDLKSIWSSVLRFLIVIVYALVLNFHFKLGRSSAQLFSQVPCP